MKRPPTLPEAEARALVMNNGIHTFSNGTSWEVWADPNCYSCWWWNEDIGGADCAFEGAAMLSMVTPELARMFGWTQDPQWDKPDDHRHGWDAPDRCAFFRARQDDNGDDNPPPPEPDPLQLVLLADPTEDAAVLAIAPAHELVSA